MSKGRKTIFCLIILLVTIIVASSYYLLSNYLKEKQQKDIFDDLERVIESDNMSNNVEKDNIQNETNEISQINDENTTITNYTNVDLKSLKKQNTDLIGWVKIDGTNINYPVMQNGEYYLNKNFYKKQSQLGTPFLASHCNLNANDNLIIYGHHIKSGLMFANLEKYKSYNFYKSHQYIKFYTLENEITIENTYQIVYAFKTTANSDGFKYYYYNHFYDELDYEEFISNCNSIQLYNTGINTSYGDNFIMLSTCEYSRENGRMVIVGKHIS